MKILVTGKRGQVALALAERAAARPAFEVVHASRPELDLADPGTIAPLIEAAAPDLVVSAAAYTAVDRAEEEPELAYAVNAAGAGAVAAAAARIGVPVIHLSTDYVFSGDKDGAYDEADPPDPASAYGRTKLDGEIAVARANRRHVILRTAWVYSPFGRNFVSTMLDLARSRDKVRVVSDQRGNPTSALDIADGILAIAGRLAEKPPPDAFGVFHLAGSGQADWSEFAGEVFAASRALGGPFATVEKITTADFPTRAKRPRNSTLCCARLLEIHGWRAPDWRSSCRETVARLLQNELAARSGGKGGSG